MTDSEAPRVSEARLAEIRQRLYSGQREYQPLTGFLCIDLAHKDALAALRDLLTELDAVRASSQKAADNHRYLMDLAHKQHDEDVAAREAAESEAGRLREAMAWRPIETAPKDGTTILLKGRGWTRTGYWARRAGCWSVDGVGALDMPDQWCALPPSTPAQETE